MKPWKKAALYAGTTFVAALVAPGMALAQTSTEAQPADGVAPAANAQVTDTSGSDARASAQPGQLGDIIVTAERRAERLIDVPISVTALDSQQLKSQQIADVTSLAGAVPSVNVLTGLGDPSDIAIGIRGLASVYLELNYDNPVGVYVNGVYFSRTAGANVGMVDMQSVEVLRGPQGTLFGRNTIGGALNITTAKPTDHLEGSLTGEFGNYNAFTFTDVLNVPLGSKVDARLVYQHVQHDGYGRDVYLGQDLASQNQNYLRGTLDIKPEDNWDVTLYGDYLALHGDAQASKLAWVDTTSPLNTLIPALAGHPGDAISNYVGGDAFHNSAGIDPRLSVRTYTASATITHDMGWGTLKSITGFHGEHAERGLDADTTPYVFFDIPAQPFRYHQVSEELQLYGDALDDRLNWITGAYYFTEAGKQSTVVQVAPAAGIPQQNDLYHAFNRNMSVFAQLSYKLTDTLKLTGGARYSADHREITYLDTITAGGVTVPMLPAVYGQLMKANYHYVPWTVDLDYKPDSNTLIYAKISQGFRSGGFPQGGYTALEDYAKFNPENLISTELGAKFDFLDHHLRISSAAYYSWYNKIQQTQNFVDNGVEVSTTANVGDAHLYGGEFEATALIGALRLSGSAGLVHATYTKGPLVGQPFVSTPKWTASTSASYPVILSFGTVTFNADYAWRSKVYFADPSATPTPEAAQALTQRAFGLVNGKVTFDLANSPIELALWARNLADKRYKAQALNFAGVGIVPFMPGDPRTFGGTISYRF